jgi:tRNA threonylcarbamoyladenosine biosynthesis protein TsaB
MLILALDTTTRLGSVAIWHDGALRCQAGQSARSHAERLPGELTEFLAVAGLTLRDVDVFAIVAGPGSFTGLRVGLAAVQGLALASGKLVVAVPTLEAMASAWLTASPPVERVRLVPCLDAMRGDLFFSAYDLPAGTRRLADARLVIPPSVGHPEEMLAAIEAAGGVGRVVVAGDGAAREHGRLTEAGFVVDADLEPLAGAAARVAAARLASAVPPHAVRPLYIRRPDVELARERAGVPR